VKKRTFPIRKLAPAVLFTVGNSLIRYPWRAAGDETLTLLLSLAIALPAVLLLYPLLRELFGGVLHMHPIKRIVAVIVSAVIGTYALFCAYRSCADYIRFTSEMILPSAHALPLALGFLLSAAWLSSLDSQRMNSFALLSLGFVLLCVVVLFLFGFPYFQRENLPLILPKVFSDPSVTLPMLWKESLLPLVILSAYFARTVPKRGRLPLALGVALGSLILALCVVQTLLIFGAFYAAELRYPYSYAVRILSVGPYFFRLEGGSYLLDYLFTLLRSAICLATARRLFGRFLPRAARLVPFLSILPMMIAFLTVFPSGRAEEK
jgi:hypothetical protein